MRFLIAGGPHYSYRGSLDAIAHALTSQGHEVRVDLPLRHFREYTRGHLKRRLVKMGFLHWMRRDLRRMSQGFIEASRTWRPDFFWLFLGSGYGVDPDALRAVQTSLHEHGGRSTLFFLDRSAHVRPRQPAFADFLAAFDDVFCFDPRDPEELRRDFGRDARAFHHMVDPRVFHPDPDAVRDLDLSFVGAPYPARLRTLERVARHAAARGLSLRVAGVYWSDGHVRKTRAFQRDYPALAPCVDNRLVTPEEAASMYRRSRIGLNVHGNGHHGLSVRTFEILACGTYQLVDALPGLRDTLRVGYDLDAFENDDDLCVKIDAALADPDRCRAIASQGERTVRERFTAHRVVEDLVDVLTRSAAAARP